MRKKQQKQTNEKQTNQTKMTKKVLCIKSQAQLDLEKKKNINRHAKLYKSA